VEEKVADVRLRLDDARAKLLPAPVMPPTTAALGLLARLWSLFPS
jgi:hypothetical protein